MATQSQVWAMCMVTLPSAHLPLPISSVATGTGQCRCRICFLRFRHRFINHTETAGARIAIAPNPVVDKINVQLTGLSENTYRMELLSVTGQKFAEKTINITRYSQPENLPRTVAMTPGIYFLTYTIRILRRSIE